MTTPAATLPALRASTADLLRALAGEQWSDADAHAPSLLPGWTRGHVLTHLARNADGIGATLSGALRGEVLARYPDGPAGRDADIEAGAGRPLGELLLDLEQSADRLDRLFGAVADADGWELTTDQGRPAAHWALARWQEVEIHRIDLAGSYRPQQWPAAFVAHLLPLALDGLAERTDAAVAVTVTADGSLSTDLPGATRQVGAGEPIAVSGPDWAVLAWLIGRADIAADALSATPPLAPWR